MRLEADGTSAGVWEELWTELHHQGDVGDASYAAVPHLVRIHRTHGRIDWNTYALVATIELARDSRSNPAMPEWLADGYGRALEELAGLALEQLKDAKDPESVRSMLAIIAIWKGVRTYGRVLAELSEDEVRELEEQALGERE
jgi:hypothetical protein